ncbi:MAG: DUF4194 domain-containing protein [Raoultibacter sp.]
MSDKASEQFDPSEEEPLEDEGLWRGDCGTLSLTSRRALLQLVRGPLINAETNRELWQALFHDRAIITSRLCDLCLTLVINEEDGIAFVQNAPTQDTRIPKAVRNQPLTLIDTILVLTLRRELVIGHAGRVFIGREEAFGTVAQYRPLAKLDESAFQKRLEASWGKLVSAGILLKTDLDERYEISPVLKLIFGADEVKTINAVFDAMLENPDQSAGAQESEG